MKPMNIMPLRRRAPLIARIVALVTLTSLASFAFAIDPNQSELSAPPGDGWQVLSSTPSTPVAVPMVASNGPTVPRSVPPPANATAATAAGGQSAYAVAPVVLAGSGSTVPGGILTLSITPQDINLRNALDRWLQQQGWQLAWKIDDDLPLEFNATFSGDFDSVLTQVMRATNHMRTPTRVCEHSNNVVRVVARAANCQD
jgi:hypothetical protein